MALRAASRSSHNRINGALRLVVIKTYREEWRRLNEHRAIRLVQQTDALVARIWWSCRLYRPWTVFRYIAGPTVSAAEGTAALRQVLGYLSEVHTVTGAAFGRLADGGYPSWQAYLAHRIGEYHSVLCHYGLPIARDVAMAIQQATPPAVAKPRLIHNDPNPANFIRSPRGVVGLDWELAAFGDPRLDTARAAWEWSLSPPEAISALGLDADERALWYYQSLHVLGRLMNAYAAASDDRGIGRRCVEWLRSGRWRAAL
jgi:aminoglycoside phosphotransferase (APT) family kinase protein